MSDPTIRSAALLRRDLKTDRARAIGGQIDGERVKFATEDSVVTYTASPVAPVVTRIERPKDTGGQMSITYYHGG
jgi:hypothetical protein